MVIGYSKSSDMPLIPALRIFVRLICLLGRNYPVMPLILAANVALTAWIFKSAGCGVKPICSGGQLILSPGTLAWDASYELPASCWRIMGACSGQTATLE